MKNEHSDEKIKNEFRYVEFGSALDCLERLSMNQLKLLKSAIETEIKERIEKKEGR